MGSWCGVVANVGRGKTRRPNLAGKGDPEEECWGITPAVLAAVEPNLSSTRSSQSHFQQFCCRQNWHQIHNSFPVLFLFYSAAYTKIQIFFLLIFINYQVCAPKLRI